MRCRNDALCPQDIDRPAAGGLDSGADRGEFAVSRPDPMGDSAAESALLFLAENAEKAGTARAQMTYLEHWRKSELARLKRIAPEKTDAAKEAWAREHEEYRLVLDAQWAAIKEYETLSWRRTQAEATISAWQTRNANQRGAHRMQ